MDWFENIYAYNIAKALQTVLLVNFSTEIHTPWWSTGDNIGKKISQIKHK